MIIDEEEKLNHIKVIEYIGKKFNLLFDLNILNKVFYDLYNDNGKLRNYKSYCYCFGKKHKIFIKPRNKYFIFFFRKSDENNCYRVIGVNKRKHIGKYLSLFWGNKFLVYYSTTKSMRIYENEYDKNHVWVNRIF